MKEETELLETSAPTSEEIEEELWRIIHALEASAWLVELADAAGEEQ